MYDQITLDTVMEFPDSADIAYISALKHGFEGRNIEDVEAELLSLLKATKKHWVKEYILLKEVRESQIFAPAFSSFTQWVEALAEKAGVHTSTIWSHLKAGEIYAKHVARAEKKGVAADPIEKINIPVETLKKIGTIAGNNDAVADDLIKKAAGGNLTREDLKAAAAAVKAQRESRGEKGAATSRHDKEAVNATSEDITAMQLVIALSDHRHEWLEPLVPDGRRFVSDAYTALAEFPVRTGTTRHARRIDVLIAEALTCNGVGEIHLHGVENKVSRSDLLRDTKVGEYADFVDFLWLCFPSELAQDALSIALPAWGLLEYTDEGILKIARVPEKLPAALREEALVDLALKLIKR